MNTPPASPPQDCVFALGSALSPPPLVIERPAMRPRPPPLVIPAYAPVQDNLNEGVEAVAEVIGLLMLGD